jgi:phage replication-related protein YjqB (UPF0714/DUF867 family)
MDRFNSFKQLCRHAAEGRDFIIEIRKGRSAFAVMAPHGGGIEPGTDTIAAAIAGDEHGFYAFRGIRTRNNAELHLASERFDEPRALALARQAQNVVTMHGCRGRISMVYAGGLAGGLKIEVINSLQTAGFAASDTPGPSLGGIHRSNLCNRGQSGKGLQLELSEQLRRQLMARGQYQPNGNDQFKTFVAAVRRALARFTQSLQNSI